MSPRHLGMLVSDTSERCQSCNAEGSRDQPERRRGEVMQHDVWGKTPGKHQAELLLTRWVGKAQGMKGPRATKPM